MAAAVTIGPGDEEREDDQEDDEYVPGRTSFFDDGPGADERIAAVVWNIYARRSTDRGDPCAQVAVPRPQSKPLESPPAIVPLVSPPEDVPPRAVASLKPASPPPAPKEPTVYSDSSDLTPYLASIRDAFVELSAAGSNPDASEVANKAGLDGSGQALRNRVYTAISTLRKKGALPPRVDTAPAAKKPKVTKATKPPTPSLAKRTFAVVETNKTKASPAREARTPRAKREPAASSSPASSVDVVRSEIERLERRLSALRSALDLLEEG